MLQQGFYICCSLQVQQMADVYYFNPTCELAVANGSFSYMPPQLLRNFETDCSVLPYILSTSRDFVLTDKVPSGDFIKSLANAGFEMPEFCSLNELISGKTDLVNAIYPWGWSPSAHFILKELKSKCSTKFSQSPVFEWIEEHKKLYERLTSLQFLTSFLEQNTLGYFIEQEMTGTKVLSIEEIENELKHHVPLVLKAPLSSSGRGIQVIRNPILNTSNKQWVSGILSQQKYLIAEPFLDKIADFSFQFRISNKGEPEYLGHSFFETNTNGQYRSSLIHPEIEGSEFCVIYQETKEIIGETAIRLAGALKNSVYTRLHRGFLGIDAMVYRDKNGFKIQPCIEINCRMNMGILTMFIEKKTDQNTTGKFELFHGQRGDFQKFAKINSSKNPVKMKNGKLSSGFLPLVEPDEEKQFGACITLTAK